MRWLGWVAVLAVAGAAAGCGGSSGSSAASPFDDEKGRTVACMAHQTRSPVGIDSPGPKEDVQSVLAYLRYYTQFGNRPYCDGKPASAVDRRWLALYVASGADPAHVRRARS